LLQARAHITANVETVALFLAEHVPEVDAILPQASYLVWLDCTKLGLRGDALDRFFVEEARLKLSEGRQFAGADADAFQRMNVACSRDSLDMALGRLRDAVVELRRRRRGGAL
jgi:cysteine-S-conjugate beta-lyase